MKKFIDYFIHSHDPILGIKSSNLTRRLTPDNWQKKAIILWEEGASVYLYLTLASCARERRRYYCATAYDLAEKKILSRQLFSELTAALAHVAERQEAGVNTAPQDLPDEMGNKRLAAVA